jgi:hypothetical protein
MRANAARIAPKFSAQGIEEWIDRSLELGYPYDGRFEELMPQLASIAHPLRPWHKAREWNPPDG